MRKIIVLIFILISNKVSFGQSQNYSCYQEFDLFRFCGIKPIQEKKNSRNRSITTIVNKNDSIIKEIFFCFPRVRKIEPIKVRLYNISEVNNLIFVADTSIFSPAFTREYQFKNYFRDTFYRLDSNKILFRSVLASNKEIGSETYNLVSKKNDTIIVENVYSYVNDKSSKCLIYLGEVCFGKSYRAYHTGEMINDNYLEKWFIQANKVVKITYSNDLEITKDYYRLIDNSLFYSFLYRY